MGGFTPISCHHRFNSRITPLSFKLNDAEGTITSVSCILKNRHWLPAIQRIHFYFPACHLLVWEPYFSLLNCLSSVCLGRSYYLFHLKSLVALFPKARTPFICFSIFHDILKIWLSRTSSSHDLWSEYVFPMKILATRCFKNFFSLTSATCLGLPEYWCAMASLQTPYFEPFLGSRGAVTLTVYSKDKQLSTSSKGHNLNTLDLKLYALTTHCQTHTKMDMKRWTQMTLIVPPTETSKVFGRYRTMQKPFGAQWEFAEQRGHLSRVQSLSLSVVCARWYMFIISAFGRLRWEDLQF